jgi:hypothetical protein
MDLVIDTQSGETFASVSAVARMCLCGESKIRHFLNSQKIDTIKAEVPTATGFKTSRLLNESQILTVVHRYRSELLIKFAQAGLRVFLHQLAGYKVSSAVQKTSDDTLDPKLEIPWLKGRIEALETIYISQKHLQKSNNLQKACDRELTAWIKKKNGKVTRRLIVIGSLPRKAIFLAAYGTDPYRKVLNAQEIDDMLTDMLKRQVIIKEDIFYQVP